MTTQERYEQIRRLRVRETELVKILRSQNQMAGDIREAPETRQEYESLAISTDDKLKTLRYNIRRVRAGLVIVQ